MPDTKQRPYLKDPKQFSYWKKSASQHGEGVELLNYPSPFARELWYYLRAIGHVKHPPGWKHNMHRDEDGYVLHVVQHGELWHEAKGRRHVVRRGQACLLDLRNDPTYGVEGATNAEFFWALLHGRDMPRVFLELGADQDPLFPLEDLRVVESLLRELGRVTLRERPAHEVRASGLLTLVLAELFASRAGSKMPLSLSESAKPLSESVRKGIDYMIRFYDKPITVKHIADVCRQSLFYFSRRFRQEMRVSPIEYLNRYRIEQAKKLLAASNQGVEQIARSVGFRNHNYFSRTFVRLIGVTPLAYRKQPRSPRQ